MLDRQYQASRDAISDQRWQKEFDLSLAKSKKARGSGKGGLILDVSEPLEEKTETKKKKGPLEDPLDFNDR